MRLGRKEMTNIPIYVNNITHEIIADIQEFHEKSDQKHPDIPRL